MSQPSSRYTPAKTPADLTERQREIGALVVSGIAHKVIAADLHITLKTLRNHLTDIYARTGTQSQMEFAVWWHKWHSFAAGGALPQIEWGPRELAPVLAEALAAEVERRVYRLPAHLCRGQRYVHAAGVIESVRHLLTGETRRPTDGPPADGH